MRKGFRQIIVLVVLFAFTAIYLNGTRLFLPNELNSSYFSNLRYEGAGNEWNRSLFGEQSRWASMENYLRVAREYDERKNYGLLNDADEARYHKQFRELARNALNDWQGYQMGAARGKLAKELDTIPTWYAIRTSKSPPLMVAGVLAAAYTGRTLRYRLGSDSTIESRTILQSSHFESQYVGWSNSLLGASVGSTYDSTAGGGFGMSISKSVTSGVSVSYDRRPSSDAVGMVYSAGF